MLSTTYFCNKCQLQFPIQTGNSNCPKCGLDVSKQSSSTTPGKDIPTSRTDLDKFLYVCGGYFRDATIPKGDKAEIIGAELIVKLLREQITLAQADCAAMRQLASDKIQYDPENMVVICKCCGMELNKDSRGHKEDCLAELCLSSATGKELLAAMALKDAAAEFVANELINGSDYGSVYDCQMAAKLRRSLTPSTASELVKDGERLDWLQVQHCDLSNHKYAIVKIPRMGATLRQAIDTAIAKIKE